MVAAVGSKGMLWAKTDTRGKPAFSLKKAFFWAVWIEIAMIVGFASIDFDKRWNEVKNSKILRAVPVELPPELEEPPEEIKKPPPPPAEQKPQEKPKQDVKEAAPIEVDTPPPAATRSANAVSVPEAVGEVSQGAGSKSEAPAAPSPAPTAAPAPVAPAAPAGPRSVAALANRQECMAALVAGYPREARRANQEGTLTALVSVDPSGQVTHVEITHANPRRVFDRALTRGLMSPACRFTPAPSSYQAIVPFEYKLSGEILE